MKRIIAHLKENGLKYGFETLVVTVGILVAFGLNTWREGLNERKLEQEVLLEIRAGLQKDLSDIDFNTDKYENALESQNIIIEWMVSDLPYNDSLCYNFASSFLWTYVLTDDGPYETLKGIGLRLVKNDSLRNKISELYDMRYGVLIEANRDYIDVVLGWLISANAKYFDKSAPLVPESDLIGCIHPTDPEAIKRSQELLHNLKTIRGMNKFNIEYGFKPIRSLVEELIERIDNELLLRPK